MKKIIYLLLACFSTLSALAQPATVGKPLTPWKEGYLDLHHINTGMGNAAYYIFPDGTTMLVDAGEMSPKSSRAGTSRNSVIHPDDTKKAYEWIAYYIGNVAPDKKHLALDYALVTHFHDDHFGSWYPQAPFSKDKTFRLSGITGVGELIPIHLLMDRGYPNYDFPGDSKAILKQLQLSDSIYLKPMDNYRSFVKSAAAKGMKTEMFKAGSASQIKLNNPSKFPDFYVQNIKANGKIWTGKDSSTTEHFTNYNKDDSKTWPDENSLSNALVIHYGPFVYYTGGDNGGHLSYGDSPFRDVETPIAKVVGEVDVATLDHHGNRDAVNESLVKTLQPRVWIGQTWSSDHPGHEVLIRMTTPYLYKGNRDLFSTNMLEANKSVIGPLIDKAYKSQQGHIVVRVMPGGKSYYVIILDDTSKDMLVKAVFGPYAAKKSDLPKLIGHRGGVIDTTNTENSLNGLKAAYKRGYYMAEIDVRLTKDDQLIIQHDADLNKYYHLDKKVQDVDWNQIRNLKSDRDGSSPILFEDALKYCQGHLEIMLDNKIIGDSPVILNRIEVLLRKYNLLNNALIIGTDQTRNHFNGKAYIGYSIKALKQMKAQNQLDPKRYYLFEHGNVLTEDDVKWAQANQIMVVPSINGYHYLDAASMKKPRKEIEGFVMKAAKKDVENLKKWGVIYFQIDSEFDQWLIQ